MEYELMYGEEIPTTQLVTKLAAVMQEYTQSGYLIFLSIDIPHFIPKLYLVHHPHSRNKLP